MRTWLSGVLHDWAFWLSERARYAAAVAWRWGHGGPSPEDRIEAGRGR